MLHFKRILEYHKLAGLKAPEHPLISLINYDEVNYPDNIKEIKWRQDYFTVGLKRNVAYKFFYGQQEYDFDEGVMTFIAPNQVMSLAENPNLNTKPSGWLLLIHPDFLWNTILAKKIKNYQFFGYAVNEALFLSDKEEKMMISILNNIRSEYQSNTDQFSQNIIISQVELLLNYAERFYERQFRTRKVSNHKIVTQLETLLSNYFNQENLIDKGLPSVQWIAEELCVSTSYLTSVLKNLTGQNTQQHIHSQLIRKAKELLNTSEFTVSEIAYYLGFEYPSSFTKLFKNKTTMSPLEFRKTFN
ncbi:helix-turn-helix domain-containing protein [Tenacibaculum jejuense]|uniref:Transcriptional regulator, AraC family n=1 Tax=Tenacibaculum jejuense TaxID=584609 RepID=A0A238UE70_9FLAO|nr:response regulator transcription factor [Tenacibaculum jejuense]SNR16774.1 Transcriptional regulator, AraC family [Tenacibaculum jejuense]